MGFKNILWQGSSLKQDASNRLVTDKEKTIWNNKANNSHTHTKSEVGLGNVDNTADSTKSVKYATSAGSATKVTQSAIKSSDYTNWRPIIWGSSNSANEGFTPTTVTDSVFSDPNLTYQPSSGTLRATVFKGKLSGTADAANSVAWGNVSGKPSTFTPSSHTHTKSQITDFGTHVYDATISRDANTVLAAPNGSSGVATFRKLVAADIPSLTKSKISDFPTSLPASDVYSWAKASTKPSYSKSEVGLGNVDNTADKNKSVNYANSAGTASHVPNSGEGTGNMARHVWFSNTDPETSRVYSDKFQYNPATDVLTVGSITGSAGSVAWGNVSGRPSSLPASDVYAWAKASSKPSYTWNEIASKPSTFTPSSHTHNYAGSSSVGGSANSAVKLDTSTAGSATQPVYFSGGKPVACSYTLGKSVPSNAVFTDTDTWRPLGTTANTACAGNDSRLSNSRPASDVYSWAKASSKPSYAWSEITSKPSTFTPSSHTHTKSQVGLGNVDNTADSAKSVKYATSAGSATTASQLMLGSRATTFNWNGQGGQPEWLFGSNESNITGGSTSNVYVYNPSNFHVAHANESSTLGITANPTNSNNLDTPLNFAQHSVSAYFITTNGQVTDQPSTYGMLLNVGWPGSDCHQIWMNQPGGRIYQRGGNSAGWSGSWHRILCDDDIIETSYYYNAGDALLYTPNESAIRFNGGTPWGIVKLPNSLQVVNGEGSKFRFQNRYCYCDAGFVSSGIWNATASNAANMFINSNGFVYHSTSASKYKLDIKPLEEDSSYPYKLLNLQPKQWFDKGETERYAELLSKEYSGEEIDEEFKQEAECSSLDSYYGLIAEDLEATGLEKFCSYGKENTDGKKEVEGIMYDRIPILMIPILKDLVEYVKTTYPLIKDSIKDKDAASKVSSIIDRMNSINDSTMVNTTYKVDNTEK